MHLKLQQRGATPAHGPSKGKEGRGNKKRSEVRIRTKQVEMIVETRQKTKVKQIDIFCLNAFTMVAIIIIMIIIGDGDAKDDGCQ